MNSKELFAQAAAKATAALAATDAAESAKLADEAESLRKHAESVKSAEAVIAQASQPVMPADLPAPAAKSAPVDTGHAAYVLRYGEEDNAVKAILTDLHGADYEQQRYAKARDFNRWLRDYSNPQIGQLGHTFLWTPASVKTAIRDGQDVGAMKTVMTEAADVLGGYIVPEDFRTTVVERLMGLTQIRPRATVVQTSRDKVTFPKATGGDSQYTSNVRVTWVDETPTAGTAATNLTWGTEEISIYTAMAEAFLTRNLVEDAAFDLGNYLARKFAEAAAMDEDNQFLTGLGNGTPYGILPGSANPGTRLTEVTTGSAAACTWDGIIKLVFGVNSQYRQANTCAFLAEKATYQALALLVDGFGQYYWRTESREKRTMEGYTALEQEAMPTIGANTYPLLFGDFSGYYIADRVGMSVERYLDSSTARINQVCYVMRRRLGGNLLEPWKLAVQKCAT